jgi:hypothetical protein
MTRAALIAPSMQHRGVLPGVWPVGTTARCALVAVAIVFIGAFDVVVGQEIAITTSTSTTTTTPTLHTTTPSHEACPAVAACLNSSVCSTCWNKLVPIIKTRQSTTLSFVARSAQRDFLFELNSSTCFRNNNVVSHLGSAANEIYNRPCLGLGFHTPVADPCLRIEFSCVLLPACRQCMLDLYTYTNKSDAILSPSCSALEDNGVQQLAVCAAFPQCTFAKQQCTRDDTHDCPQCLDMMIDGNVIGAVQHCTPSMPDTANSSVLLDNVAFACTADNDLSCSYFKARCNQNVTCRDCFSDVGGAQTAQEMARAFLNSTSCLAVIGNGSSAGSVGDLLFNVFEQCGPTGFTACQDFTARCILGTGGACARCLEGPVPPQNDCEAMLTEYSLHEACQPCSSAVYEYNRIVLATSVVGGLSTLPCLGVIIAIVAYSKDTMYIRSRIIIGLMVSNIVYSIGNAIPVAMLQTFVNTCGQTSLSFSTMRFGRSVWFAGKYALVFFELFILSVAVWALTSGLRNLGGRREAFLHATCALGGIAAFVGFFVQSGVIEGDGYNSATQAEAQSNAFTYLGPNDDLNDDLPMATAETRFTNGRNEFDALVQRMLQVWVAFLVLCILTWLYLRWTFSRLTKIWLRTLSDAEKQWDRDLWAPDQQGTRQTKRRFLVLIKESYDELFLPLEPFVAVFILFGIPACVIATDFCVEHSRIHTSHDGGVGTISVGFCNVTCELILSFRSIATVAVFFYSRENRNEIYHVRTLWRRLCARAISWVRPSERRQSSNVRFRSLLLEEVHMIPSRDDDTGVGEVDDVAGATVPYKLMDDAADDEGAATRNTEL